MDLEPRIISDISTLRREAVKSVKHIGIVQLARNVLRWSQIVGQFGGEVKVYSGV